MPPNRALKPQGSSRPIEWALERLPFLWAVLRRGMEGSTFGDRELLRELVRRHYGPWLDIGCGTGRYACLFNPENYVGTDPSVRRLRAASRLAPRHTFICADSSLLVQQRRRYAGILISQVLHHLEASASLTLLGDARRLLAPGGVLVLLEWEPPQRESSRLHKLCHRLESPHNSRTEAEWRSALSAGGFSGIESHQVKNTRFAFCLLTARIEAASCGQTALSARTSGG